jgi:hypothetical protein
MKFGRAKKTRSMSRSMPLAMAEAGALRGLTRVRHPLRACTRSLPIRACKPGSP